MSGLLRRIFLGVIALSTANAFVSSPAYAKSYYQKFTKRQCSVPAVVKNERLVHYPFSKDEPIDQGDYGSCYGLTSFQLVQFLYDETRAQNQLSREKLSLLDFIAQGCQLRFREGGEPYSVLYQVQHSKKHPLAIEPYPLQYSNFVQHLPLLKETIEEKNSGLFQKYFSWFKTSLFSSEWSSHVPDLDLFYSYMSVQMEPKERSLYKFITELPQIQRRNVPDYNVHVFESASEKSIDDQVQEVLNYVSTRFSDSLQPIVLNFCPADEGDDGCIGNLHSVIIEGVRESHCLGNVVQEWKINNSYGSRILDGWMMARPLAESVVKYQENLVHIEACGSSSNQKECVPYILGRNPVHYLIATEAWNDLTQLLQKSREELKKRQIPTDAPDRDGRTPLYDAIGHGKVDLVKLLIQQGANLNRIDDWEMTPLSYAVSIGAPEKMIRLLIKSGAKPGQRPSFH